MANSTDKRDNRKRRVPLIQDTATRDAIDELYQLAVPSGLIAPFAADVCPPGWTRVVELNGKFPRGAPTGTGAGATGGADTKTAHLSNSSINSTYYTGGGVTTVIPLPPANTDSFDNRPAYYEVIYCRKD